VSVSAYYVFRPAVLLHGQSVTYSLLNIDTKIVLITIVLSNLVISFILVTTYTLFEDGIGCPKHVERIISAIKH